MSQRRYPVTISAVVTVDDSGEVTVAPSLAHLDVAMRRAWTDFQVAGKVSYGQMQDDLHAACAAWRKSLVGA